MRLVPDVTNIPFMKFRNYAFGFSIITSLAALGLFAAINMNYGIDFKGGSLIEVQAKGETADIGAIRSKLSELNIGDVQVQTFGTPRDVMIRVESQDLGENAEQAVVAQVREELGDAYEFRRVEVVGATVSSELVRNGFIGVGAALLAILAYVWFRFEWQFGLGAIIATGHDIVLTIGLFVVTGMEFNLTSIAAILTIMGYSLNDTVVVYDRVRENLRRFKKMPIPELLDLSMNQTLSRTVLTGLTTLLALGALCLFGGEVIRSFTIAMIFGIVVGTYSSIFVAGPLLILFKLRPGGNEIGDQRRLGGAFEAIAMKGIEIRAAHFPGRAPIDAYGNGGFRFADMSHIGSILCLPSGIHGWTPQDAAALVLEDIERILAEAGDIEVLLFGMGRDLRPIPKPIKEALRERRHCL